MPVSEIKGILREAKNAQRGFCAFNYSDVWDLMAIANAAESMGVDVIVASPAPVAENLGPGVCQAMVDAVSSQKSISLYNHLDHSNSVDLCIKAIDAGYPSVMIDGSKLGLEENIRMTGEVVKYAHQKGVMVEGEVGKIKGSSVEGEFTGGIFLAEVDEVVELVAKTNVDSLAVGIGTAHGFYSEEPKIHFDRLAEIAPAVDVPLVLHGGTGIPDEDIRKALKMGMTKVNVGTIIYVTYMNSLKKALNEVNGQSYTLDIMDRVLPYVKDVTVDRIRVITQAGTE